MPTRSFALSTVAAVMATSVVCLAPAAAYAQSSPSDLAAAQTLFDEGKRLMEAHDYEHACPKFEESERLDPAGGTAFALALCYDGAGKTASAWAAYTQAVSFARKDRRADRERAASDRLAALEKRLVRLRVVVAADVPGLEVRRGGEIVGRAQWGVAIPVDPGAYGFEAHAPQKEDWKGSVSTGPEGSTVDVVVPALKDEPSANPFAPPTATATPPKATAPPPASPQAAVPPPAATEPPRDPGATQRTWGYVVGGVGLAATTVGVVFGLFASSKWSDAKKACPNDQCANPANLSLGTDAGRFADVSTASFVVGAVGIGAAAVLLLTAPHARPESSTAARIDVVPSVAPGSAGLFVRGVM